MPRLIAGILIAAMAGSAAFNQPEKPEPERPKPAAPAPLNLGNFSVSLTVKDLAASRAFYEKLGFRTFGGAPAKNWVILQNGTTTIGLFQGMIPKNSLTFNPGWDNKANTLPEFTDVRDLQKELKSRGVAVAPEADPASTGPAFFMITDPDGNPILFDQHIPKPSK